MVGSSDSVRDGKFVGIPLGSSVGEWVGSNVGPSVRESVEVGQLPHLSGHVLSMAFFPHRSVSRTAQVIHSFLKKNSSVESEQESQNSHKAGHALTQLVIYLEYLESFDI